MKVLVLYTRPPEAVTAGRDAGEFDLSAAAAAVGGVLPGAAVVGVRGTPGELFAAVESHRPEVVFNLCEAPLGRPDREAHAASLFEWLGVRFTGSGSETLALCRRKDRTRAVLASAGVPIAGTGRFPCIVKPADEDGSYGIDVDSICRDAAAAERVKARVNGPVVVEDYLPGPEFVISLWGRSDPDHVSIGKAVFRNGLTHFTYASKWLVESDDFRNSALEYQMSLEPDLRSDLTTTAVAAWRAVGARGYLRLDLRLDADGTPRVLDVNPNPELAPEVGIHRAVVEAGWSWERFVRAQVVWASA